MSSRQRQQEKKIKVMQNYRREHSYLSGTYHFLLLLLNEITVFQFEMFVWNENQCIYSKTSKVETLLCLHKWNSTLSRGAFKADSPRGHKLWTSGDINKGFRKGPHGWMATFTSHIPQRTPVDTRMWKAWIGLQLQASAYGLASLSYN